METVKKIRASLGPDWIPDLYREHIRPLRTRSFKMDIPERENEPMILETLLGKEIKIGRSRIYCPDADTVRYVSIFARLGCREFAVPYDITTLGKHADALESAWRRTLAEIESATAASTPQGRGRVRAALIRSMRNEIAKIGAGERMPLFDSSTRQRKS